MVESNEMKAAKAAMVEFIFHNLGNGDIKKGYHGLPFKAFDIAESLQQAGLIEGKTGITTIQIQKLVSNWIGKDYSFGKFLKNIVGKYGSNGIKAASTKYMGYIPRRSTQANAPGRVPKSSQVNRRSSVAPQASPSKMGTPARLGTAKRSVLSPIQEAAPSSSRRFRTSSSRRFGTQTRSSHGIRSSRRKTTLTFQEKEQAANFAKGVYMETFQGLRESFRESFQGLRESFQGLRESFESGNQAFFDHHYRILAIGAEGYNDFPQESTDEGALLSSPTRPEQDDGIEDDEKLPALPATDPTEEAPPSPPTNVPPVARAGPVYEDDEQYYDCEP